MELYVNAKGFWVLKVDLDTIESEAGFVAYLNVLLNRHAVVQTFKLVRVVEHWHILPGDGHVYFASALCFQRRKIETSITGQRSLPALKCFCMAWALRRAYLVLHMWHSCWPVWRILTRVGIRMLAFLYIT